MKPTSELYQQSFRVLFFDEQWEYEQTISDLNEKLETEKNSNAYNNLGVAYFEIGQFEEALESFNLAIEVNGQNSIAYANRADLNKKWRNISDAERDYGRAIELNPKNPNFWRCRAYLRKESGEKANALSDFKRAKKLEPKFQPTRNEIFELEKELGIKPRSWLKKLIGK